MDARDLCIHQSAEAEPCLPYMAFSVHWWCCCSKNFGAGDKVTFNGAQHLCHDCLTKTLPASPPGSVAGSPKRGQEAGGPGGGPGAQGAGGAQAGGEEPMLAFTAPPLVSSTPARPQEIGLKSAAQMNSPDSDYSTDCESPSSH